MLGLLATPAYAREIHAYHQKSMPQRENGCAGFALACLLHGLGYERWQGHEVDQDLALYLAGMVALPDSHPRDSDPGTAFQARRGFLRHYRYPLERSPELATVGTTPRGVIHALEVITQGAWAALAVRGRNEEGAPLPEDGLLALIQTVIDQGDDECPAQVLFNYQTGHLASLERSGGGWGDVLFGETCLPCEWDVGHVTSLAGIVLAGDRRPAVLVRDSSPSFGWRGYHPERPAALARALARTDGSQGGLLVLCPRRSRDELSRKLRAACPSAELGLWDNGSSFREPLSLPSYELKTLREGLG